ncbi:MAG: right-handed parallel beta-helix repeat-containing protein [Fimbriimonadales bacterium]|nr:right-handed parallel beta-helix repeat-containing protein [Fimbriimonadales bacterium]
MGWLLGSFAVALAGDPVRMVRASELLEAMRAARRAGQTTFTLPSGKLLLDAPLNIGRELSGLTVRGAPGGTWLVGASLVEGWEPVAGQPEAERLPAAARPHVWRAPIPPGAAKGELLLGLKPQPAPSYPAAGFLPIRSAPSGFLAFSDPAPARWSAQAWSGGNLLFVEGWSPGYASFRARVAELAPGMATLAETPWYPLLEGHRFRFRNALEFLSAPGEAVVEPGSGWVYWWPTDDWDDHETLMTSVQGLVRLNGADGFRFESVGFGPCLGDAVQVRSATGVVFSRCRFFGMEGRGLACTDDQVRSLTVEGCDFVECGRDGLVLRGGDRFGLAASGSVVRDCLFQRCARIERHAQGLRLSGVGHTVERCLFLDLPAAAIRCYNSGSALLPQESGLNDSTIRECLFERVSLEAVDGAAIVASRDWSSQGNAVLGCVFRGIRPGWNSPLAAPVSGIMLDDRMAGWRIEGCHFVDCQTGVHLVGGWGNTIRRCQFVNTDLAIRFWAGSRLTAWGPGVPWFDKLASFRVTVAPWSQRYPALANLVSRNTSQASFGFAFGCEVSGCQRSATGWQQPIRVATGLPEYPWVSVTMFGNGTTVGTIPSINRRMAP